MYRGVLFLTSYRFANLKDSLIGDVVLAFFSQKKLIKKVEDLKDFSSEMLVMPSQKEIFYFHSHGDAALTREAIYVTCKNQEFLFFPYYLLAHWLAHEQTHQEQCVLQCHFHLPK